MFFGEGKRTGRPERGLTALRVSGGSVGGGVIHKIFQFLAGLEIRNLLRGHFNSFPGLWIAAHASPAFAGAEAAKAANLDLFALLQSADDAVEYGFDNRFGFLARKFGNVQNFFDQVSLGECRCRLLGHLRYASSRSPGRDRLNSHRSTSPQLSQAYGFTGGWRTAGLLPFLSLK